VGRKFKNTQREGKEKGKLRSKKKKRNLRGLDRDRKCDETNSASKGRNALEKKRSLWGLNERASGSKDSKSQTPYDRNGERKVTQKKRKTNEEKSKEQITPREAR